MCCSDRIKNAFASKLLLLRLNFHSSIGLCLCLWWSLFWFLQKREKSVSNFVITINVTPLAEVSLNYNSAKTFLASSCASLVMFLASAMPLCGLPAVLVN